MSIFGTGYPVFIVSGSNTVVTMSYSTINAEYVEPNIIEHQSVINGARNYITSEADGFGDYSNFTVNIHLFKYAIPSASFSNIYQYNHQDVFFKPHSDGSTIKDSSNADVVFNITSMALNYLDTPDFKDVLTVEFKSKSYTNLANSLA